MGVPYAEVIGDPVAHSKSPIIHNFWLEKLGLGYDFRAAHVRPEKLAGYFEDRRENPQWCGCSVTIPHKVAAVESVEELSDTARFVGAVNCITRRNRPPRFVGHNTDPVGFLEPLKAWLKAAHEHRFACVIGTGGAAAAVSVALARERFTIVSVSRDRNRALALRRRLGLFDDDLAVDLARCAQADGCDWGNRTGVLDLIVNATPLGMRGYPPLEFALQGEPPNSIVYDLVYDPLETPLLKAARERGFVTIDGLEMLMGQAAAAFELFFVEPAPREHDEELRELLTR